MAIPPCTPESSDDSVSETQFVESVKLNCTRMNLTDEGQGSGLTYSTWGTTHQKVARSLSMQVDLMVRNTQNTDLRVPPSSDSNISNNCTFSLRARGSDSDALEVSSIQSAGN